MVDQETVLAHDASLEDRPKVAKEIAGKSPTQIAFSRLAPLLPKDGRSSVAARARGTISLDTPDRRDDRRHP
jgi:hypothetical protein